MKGPCLTSVLSLFVLLLIVATLMTSTDGLRLSMERNMKLGKDLSPRTLVQAGGKTKRAPMILFYLINSAFHVAGSRLKTTLGRLPDGNFTPAQLKVIDSAFLSLEELTEFLDFRRIAYQGSIYSPHSMELMKFVGEEGPEQMVKDQSLVDHFNELMNFVRSEENFAKNFKECKSRILSSLERLESHLDGEESGTFTRFGTLKQFQRARDMVQLTLGRKFQTEIRFMYFVVSKLELPLIIEYLYIYKDAIRLPSYYWSQFAVPLRGLSTLSPSEYAMLPSV
eukprot:TRINITY_DN1672_c0_g1_i1.p1 TRINITY_DN1672_c0_g1~~TRINITY_DN1672_c0_g1_i1.p1  ORF type:complete len:296 (+),score=59.61 TRINITY_DN1672_c0_g1_i1:48-890(+)